MSHALVACCRVAQPAFKKAYYEGLVSSPSFRNHPSLFSSRQWWRGTVRRAVELAKGPGKYTDAEFDRFFRRIYQHYGSLDG